MSTLNRIRTCDSICFEFITDVMCHIHLPYLRVYQLKLTISFFDWSLFFFHALNGKRINLQP